MDKAIKSIKTLASKKVDGLELRKEHVIYKDGTTEDRTVYYTLEGVFIGSPTAKLMYLEQLKEFKSHLPKTEAPKKPYISNIPVQDDSDSKKSSSSIFPESQRSSVTDSKKDKRSKDELGY